MKEIGNKSTRSGIKDIGIKKAQTVYWNLRPSELMEHTIINREGVLNDQGALVCETGEFTGRSPKDRYIVKDKTTSDEIWWGDINQAVDEDTFDTLHQQMLDFLADKNIYVRDCYAGADKTYRMKVRVVNTLAWHNLFVHNMFLRPRRYKLESFQPNFTVLCVPEFEADPKATGLNAKNFCIINMTKRVVLIGGTAYSGEIKKSIFSALNFLLPTEHNVLPMHCSANMGKEKQDTAIFFGLSGTGKTTLSTDPQRLLIGDDEHGWSKSSVFNFEGGCYAKVIDLDAEKEPDIYNAIRFGAIVENTCFEADTRRIDYTNTSITENTRVSYPIHFIENTIDPSIGGIPKHIFLLTCDAFGVMPPAQKLNISQAMYHFISGYTAKIAGTETGVNEPQAVFSACYGAPFMPLHPVRYAQMLGEKIKEHDVKVWMINTGWTGGPYGVGNRINLPHTRALIHYILDGTIENAGFRQHSIFKTELPLTCPDVPNEILSPRETWEDDPAFYAKANKLVDAFEANFAQFMDEVTPDILDGAPQKNQKWAKAS